MAVTQLPPMALATVSDDGGGAAQGILRRQALRESAARAYARALPIVPVRARGMTVEGADGRRYLDCLRGAGALALGHNHPVVLDAIRAVLDAEAPLQVLDLATPVKDACTDELFATLPPGLAAAVQQECLRRGLIVELGGHHGAVIRLLPPLTITDKQSEAVLDRLTDALDAATRTAGARSRELPLPAAPFAPPITGDDR
ncbi:hypothetical protein GCM10009577_57910 [Streptomyces javensis]